MRDKTIIGMTIGSAIALFTGLFFFKSKNKDDFNSDGLPNKGKETKILDDGYDDFLKQENANGHVISYYTNQLINKLLEQSDNTFKSAETNKQAAIPRDVEYNKNRVFERSGAAVISLASVHWQAMVLDSNIFASKKHKVIIDALVAGLFDHIKVFVPKSQKREFYNIGNLTNPNTTPENLDERKKLMNRCLANFDHLMHSRRLANVAIQYNGEYAYMDRKIGENGFDRALFSYAHKVSEEIGPTVLVSADNDMQDILAEGKYQESCDFRLLDAEQMKAQIEDVLLCQAAL